MTGLRHVIFAAAALLSLGCDRAGRAIDCTASADPAQSSGARVDACLESTFKITDPRWRGVSGRVFSGEDGVRGAVVRVTPTVGFGADSLLAPLATVTNAAGGWGTLADAAMHYDVLAVFGRNILATQGLIYRYFEPTLDAPFPAFTAGASIDLTPALDVAYRAHIDIVPRPTLPPGWRVAFFTKGDSAVSLVGDIENGLTLSSTTFSSNASIHALAYPPDGELADATLYASAQVVATPPGRAVAALDFAEITNFQEPSIEVLTPRGFDRKTIDLIISYSRTSRAYAATVAPGVTRRIPVFPDGVSLAYRITATSADGRSIDSGIAGFDPSKPLEIDLTALESPEVIAPVPEASVAATDRFVAYGTGMFELRLVPEAAGSPVLNVLTSERSIRLPDLTSVGQALSGRYTWTLANFPKAALAENLSGRDARRAYAASITAPRTVIFR